MRVKKETKRQKKLLKQELAAAQRSRPRPPRPATLVQQYDILETSVEVTLTSEAMAVEEWISAHMAESFGLDAEWKPTFRKGARENPVALLQLSTLHHCLLIQMQRLASIPEGLRRLLAAPEVALAGVGIRDDLRKLARDFGLLCCGEVELVGLAVESLGRPDLKQCGLKRLAFEVLEKEWEKSRKISMSNWEADLEDKQISYAAADAWVSFAIHQALKKLRKMTGLKESTPGGRNESRPEQRLEADFAEEVKRRQVEVNPHGAFLKERRKQTPKRRLDEVGGKQGAKVVGEASEKETGSGTSVEHQLMKSEAEPAGEAQHVVRKKGKRAKHKQVEQDNGATLSIPDACQDSGADAPGGNGPGNGVASLGKSIAEGNGVHSNASFEGVAVHELTAGQLAYRKKKERHRKYGSKKVKVT